MDGSKGKDYLKEYLVRSTPLFAHFLEQKIKEAQYISKIPAELLKHFALIATEGKRVRGALLLLGYEMSGGKDSDAALRASLCMELFHAGILVHDDIMDEDDTRRGLTTTHVQFARLAENLPINTTPLHYGEAMAMTIGDVAMYLSWDALLSSPFSSERILAAGRIYSDYVIRLGHGQVLDVTTESIKSLREEDVMKVYRYKTAEYTGVMPLLMGATLAGEVSDTVQKAIYDYGVCFGWAFQIQDDYLGLFGKQEELGKVIGSDMEEGKNTPFVLHLSQHGSAEAQEFLKGVMGKKGVTPEDVRRIQSYLTETGSTEYVLSKGWDYVEKGKQFIPLVTSDPSKQQILESLLVYMMERTK